MLSLRGTDGGDGQENQREEQPSREGLTLPKTKVFLSAARSKILGRGQLLRDATHDLYDGSAPMKTVWPLSLSDQGRIRVLPFCSGSLEVKMLCRKLLRF